MNALPAYWFNQTVSTQRATPASGSSGGVGYTYAPNLTSVNVRFNPGGGNIAIGTAFLEVQTPHVIYAPGGTDILPHDRIIFGSRIFDVENVNDTDELGILLKISAKEVT